MGLFKKFKNKNPTLTRIKLITETGNGMYTWNGNVYNNDIVRACIRPTAVAVGKLVGKHIRENKNGIKINPEPYLRFLLEEPNPLMTGQQLQEKSTAKLLLNNNAFELIIRDSNGYASEIYPIDAANVEALYDNGMNLYLRFWLINGKTYTFPYTDIIHLRRDFCDNDIFGTPTINAIEPLMDVISTIDKGIINGIRNSGAVRWLLEYATRVRDEDVKDQAKKFRDAYLDPDSDISGVAALSAGVKATQVSPNDYIPNSGQMRETTQRVFNYFGVSEKIVQSKWTDDEWIAYFESIVEPIAIQRSAEYTRKIFTRRERGDGNRIIFDSMNLNYASMTSKLNLVSMVDRGAMTPNEWRAVMNLSPIEGGDQPIRRLDTQVIKE